MDYFRNVLLVINDKNEGKDLLNTITDWVYCDNLKNYESFEFCLVNQKENIVISFVKVNEYAYRSVNVLPYFTDEITISEPQEEDIHNDILFKLCMNIKKKFVNYEILCGIIPCEGDEI